MVTEEVYMDTSDGGYYQGGPGPGIPNLMEMPFQGPMGPPGPDNFGGKRCSKVVSKYIRPNIKAHSHHERVNAFTFAWLFTLSRCRCVI